MPRPAVIAIAVLGIVALVASTTFALVRSTQLRASQATIAALQSELAERGGGQPDGDAAGDASTDEQGGGTDGLLDGLFDGEGGLGDLFSEDGGLGGLLGDDLDQLARCIQPAGQPGSRDVPDGEAEEQITEITDTVEALRDLEFSEPPTPSFLDDQQISERLTDEIGEEYDAETAEIDRRTLAALGAVPADVDLVALQTELLTTQVAGFYDPDTDDLVVRGSPDDGLEPAEQTTLAHELQHALADEAFELPVDVTEDVDEGDAALAALSLVEGDATLTQQQFTVAGLTLAEQLGLNVDPGALAAQEQLAEVPHYLAQSLQFPYLAGLRFACARYLDGGWEAVNAAYGELPTTTAEILDPDRYGEDAVDPADPGDPGGEWRRQRATTIGAADLLWLFEAPGDDTERALDDPRDAALAWTGGELTVWTDGDDTAVGVALTQQEHDGPLCDAVTTWYERAFPEATDAPTRRTERLVREGPQQTAVVTCDGVDVRLGIASDLSTARALAG